MEVKNNLNHCIRKQYITKNILHYFIMAKMLICPDCGTYQEDTTNLRKAGVAAKIAGKWAGQQIAKIGAQAAVGMFFDSSVVDRGVGKGAIEFAKEIGLDYSKDSIDDVKYKCSLCGKYWTGQDNPSYYNEKQIATVKKRKEETYNEFEEEYEENKKKAIYGLIAIVIATIIYSLNHFSGILFYCFSVPYLLTKAKSAWDCNNNCENIACMDIDEFARQYMELGIGASERSDIREISNEVKEEKDKAISQQVDLHNLKLLLDSGVLTQEEYDNEIRNLSNS